MNVCACVVCASFVLSASTVTFWDRLAHILMYIPLPPIPLIPSHSPTLVFAFAVGFLFWFLLNLLFDFFYLFCAPSRNLKLISFQVLFTFFSYFFLEHVSLITCTECNCIIVLLLLCLLWLMFYGAIHRHIWFICPRFCGI